MTTTNILLGLLILAVLAVALIITNQNAKKVVRDLDDFKPKLPVPQPDPTPEQVRKDTRTKVALITGHTYTRVYPKLPRKERIALQRREKHEKHVLKVASLFKLGVIWTPVGLYWNTRELAELHNKSK